MHLLKSVENVKKPLKHKQGAVEHQKPTRHIFLPNAPQKSTSNPRHSCLLETSETSFHLSSSKTIDPKFCHFHEHKKAKFYGTFPNLTILFLCSDCAFYNASKNIKISPVKVEQKPNGRIWKNIRLGFIVFGKRKATIQYFEMFSVRIQRIKSDE